jgi:sugar/nucleoside kinase (ribokinase family)
VKGNKIVFGLGNLLLDVVVKVSEDFLKKYDLQADSIQLAEERHLPLYDEIGNLPSCPITYAPGGCALNTIRIAQVGVYAFSARSSFIIRKLRLFIMYSNCYYCKKLKWRYGWYRFIRVCIFVFAVEAQWILKDEKSTIFMGAVGDDDAALQLVKLLEKEGVRVECQKVSGGGKTGRCAVLVSGTARTLVTQLGASLEFSHELFVSQNAISLLKDVGVIYISVTKSVM